MTCALRSRWTNLLVVTAYLAATTLSGLPHDHDSCAHEAASHSESHEHGADVEATACDSAHHDADHDGAAHDDDCVVCRFAGQRVISVTIAPLELVSDLSVELAVVHPERPAIETARTTHSRAPPLFG